MTKNFRSFMLALAFIGGLPLPALVLGEDVKGSRDHPLVSRYEGSEILKYEQHDFDSAALIQAPMVRYSHNPIADNQDSYLTLEGKVTRITYGAPQGRSALEVFRNYEQALKAADFEVLFSCEKELCDKKDRGRAFNLAAAPKDMFGKMVGQSEEQRYLLARLKRDAGDVHVSLYLTSATRIGGPDKNRVFVNLIVVESQPMQTGMVKVDAAAMAKGLDTEGHIALYEVYFDTDKADLKPESDPALAEIAQLLTTQSALKVLIVGHTDNVGALNYNQSLSERRAKSVVEALVKKHKIAGERLTAVGVGMAAPIASNDSESGRAKNRRVELVKR